MSPAERSAGLRLAADIVERYGLDVLGVTSTKAQGVRLHVDRIPPEATDRTHHDDAGYRHATATLDGVRLTECHELTAADFEVNRE